MDDAKADAALRHVMETGQDRLEAPARAHMHILEIRGGDPYVGAGGQQPFLDHDLMKLGATEQPRAAVRMVVSVDVCLRHLVIAAGYTISVAMPGHRTALRTQSIAYSQQYFRRRGLTIRGR